MSVTFALADEVEVHRRQISNPELICCRTLLPIEGLEVTATGPAAIHSQAGAVLDGEVMELLLILRAAKGTLHPVARPGGAARGAVPTSRPVAGLAQVALQEGFAALYLLAEAGSVALETFGILSLFSHKTLEGHPVLALFVDFPLALLKVAAAAPRPRISKFIDVSYNERAALKNQVSNGVRDVGG